MFKNGVLLAKKSVEIVLNRKKNRPNVKWNAINRIKQRVKLLNNELKLLSEESNDYILKKLITFQQIEELTRSLEKINDRLVNEKNKNFIEKQPKGKKLSIKKELKIINKNRKESYLVRTRKRGKGRINTNIIYLRKKKIKQI